MQRSPKNLREKIKVVVAIVIVSGLMAAMGLASLAIGVTEFLDARESEAWPSVEGAIVRSKIKVTEDSVSRSSGTSTRTWSYQPDLEFHYVVDERPFTGTNISWGQVSNRSIAEAIVEKYPMGGSVKVFYDPSQPEKSVLEPGYHLGLMLPLGLGIVGIAAAIISGVVIWRYGIAIANSIGPIIGRNFLLRAAAFILGSFLVVGLILYLMFTFLYGP